MQSKTKEYLLNFNPEVYKYKNFNRRDLLCKFNAGDEEYSFNEFIKNESEDYTESGEGATYVVCNTEFDEESGKWIICDVVGYYTLAATSIPYEDRIHECYDEGNLIYNELGESIFNSKICGISSIELKMFAVDRKYQDLFYQSDNLDMPVAAWLLWSIISEIKEIINDTVGTKAVFLRSVPDAEGFYKRNGFRELKENMMPLHCVDADLKPMYYMLKEVTVNYED
jgi:hypothetical protein